LILHNRHYAQSRTGQQRRRRRVWHLSPDGFRELRHSCFLTPEACAKYLGVALRTVQHWDAGRCRVPWAVVRLLRFLRLGDLGALDDAWAGWTVNRNGLWSPDGKRYHQGTMRHWWTTCEQARFWREDYDRRNPVGGVGASAPARPEAVTLLTSQPGRGEQAAGLRPSLAPARHLPTLATALDRAPGEPVGSAGVDGRAGDSCRTPGDSGRDLVVVRCGTAAGAAMASGGFNLASYWHHSGHLSASKQEASNMPQTALVCGLISLPAACGKVPWANRGPTNLNGMQSDAILASYANPPRSGVA